MATLLDTADRARRDAALENSSTLKALSVLEALVRAGGPVTLTELMQATGLPKPSLHRTLALFEDGGYVQREPSGRGYAVGPRLESLGLAISGETRSPLKGGGGNVEFLFLVTRPG